MKRNDSSNHWMSFALQDLKAAKLIMEEKIYNLVCFHSQQAIEKALKAYISITKIPPKTHFLKELLGICSKGDRGFEQFKEKCLVVDQYYIPSRYPIALAGSKTSGLPNCKDALEAIDIADEIVGYVKKLLRNKK